MLLYSVIQRVICQFKIKFGHIAFLLHLGDSRLLYSIHLNGANSLINNG